MFQRSLIGFSVFLLLVIFAFGEIRESTYGIYDGKIRIVFSLTEGRDFKVFTLNDPQRIVVDVYGEYRVGRLQLPVDVKYKVGKHPWGTRIVLYYNRNFSLKYFYLRDPYRIVLDIYRESNELYAEILQIIGEDGRKVTEPKVVVVEENKPPQVKNERKVAEEKVKEDPIASLIEKARFQPVIYEDKVIVVDAGHGGKDPGAIGYGGLREKWVNLAIAKKVAQFLQEDERFKVILTRDGDYFIPLHKRAEIALKNKADLFISIHSDAAPHKNPRAKGTQVFALSYQRAAEKKEQILSSRRYAKLVLGDAADIRSGVVKKVLADLAIDVTLTESVYFARLLSNELKNVIGEDVYFKGINRAGFAVLKTPGIPSVLVETGFITNPSEANKLKDPEFQRKVAWSIYRAIVRYFYGEDFGQKLVKYE
ncbi:N-acetylmuramoyl-L-alanine amidase [Hydrogenivirga caldilitoris]|uniref:N-acetylmuramoyl-L-alanine amidase n=1 Tax=Hydrogenivirga caldilitoris TaxID=246264 RepID=A0A497XUI7_9AQUI|nr:N-acetylmuramoyl-L-alanine amidase [Hydrogenivirga caldilitoris]RLJ70563.1 N-acetylmuramoyl-L-alanine amidase [Hydrogenivirga caldilitoris]